MEEGVLPLSTNHETSSDPFMDLDYMDELLLEGCWLEANPSDFSNLDSSTPFSPFEPSFRWPSLETANIKSGNNNPSKPIHEDRQRSSSCYTENLSPGQPQLQQPCRKSESHRENINDSSAEPEKHTLEGSELSKRWWIGPRASMSVMDRLLKALNYIKGFSRDKDILIQVWVPVNRGDRRVLTTNHDGFTLDLNCPRLANYREISVNYQFPAEEDSKEAVGLPGRVFRTKVPEWTPDVRFFTRDEYPRVGHAQKYDVRGTLAVPVLEQGSRTCLGVIEVVLTEQKINYRPELESLRRALEAVDLTSSELSIPQSTENCDLSYQAALPEISEVLKSACRTHGLPLAQTWVECLLQGKGGCRHSEDNLRNCISPVDFACSIENSQIQGFHEACSEYHLLKGEGIVGLAFRTNQPCFTHDVTSFSRTEYPLSHYARMFELKAAVAIRLRSIRTGSADFVLEFFLPVNCVDPEEQRRMLTSLSGIVQNVCQTLRVITDKELREESTLFFPEKAVNNKTPTVDRTRNFRLCSGQRETPDVNSSFHDRQLLAGSSCFSLDLPESNSREGITFMANTCTSDGDASLLYANKSGEKRRIKAEKIITLQVLRQHFAGSLKDAARNLGVCPTTLKRICRQHGIQRWPSRKIKKVGHSLQKIQRVIDSVQGASGVLQIESFYQNFPELASPNASRVTQFSKSKNQLVGVDTLKTPTNTSLSPSSSCSQSSSSSQCCSSGTHPNSDPSSSAQLSKDVPVHGALKHARSDTHLPLSIVEPRLQRHVSFHEHDKVEDVPPSAAEASGHEFREKDAPRVKVSYGEDTIRFRMQKHWVYNDLLQEISRRFGVDDASRFHLRYLDDDAEWVLLTCDADLEECIDVCRLSKNHTIKLVFVRAYQTQSGKSFNHRGPLSL